MLTAVVAHMLCLVFGNCSWCDCPCDPFPHSHTTVEVGSSCLLGIPLIKVSRTATRCSDFADIWMEQASTRFFWCPWKYADTPVIPVTLGILDKGHLDTNAARENPLSVFRVTLTLGCGCTVLNSQRSFNIFHVIEDTMRPLCPRERERDRRCRSSMALCRLLLSVSQPLSHPPACCWKEGGKKDECTSCITKSVCAC